MSNTSLCIASEKDIKFKGALLVLRPCLNRAKTQLWYQTDKNELVLGGLLCLDASDRYPKLAKCHEMGEAQEWLQKSEVAIILFNKKWKRIKRNLPLGSPHICNDHTVYQSDFELT